MRKAMPVLFLFAVMTSHLVASLRLPGKNGKLNDAFACPVGTDSLPGDMTALSMFTYNIGYSKNQSKEWIDHDLKTYNPLVQELLQKSYPDIAKCWKVYGSTGVSKYFNSTNLVETPGTLRLVNTDRCIIADVYEGTRTKTQTGYYKTLTPEEKKEGRWLAPLSETLKKGTQTAKFIKEFCGNPIITQNVGMNLGDYMTEHFRGRIADRARKVGRSEFSELEFLKSDTCPDGFRFITAGHSLGGSMAMMFAYCNNYHYYGLWQKAFVKGQDWPLSVKRSLLVSAVYTFGSPQTSDGSLVDFGSLMYNEGFGGPSFCWQGARIFFAGQQLRDPSSDTYCRQAFDPIASVHLTDVPGVSIKNPCSCPQFIMPGTDPETILQSLGDSTCMFYDRYSTKCVKCMKITKNPGMVVHKSGSAHICGTRAAFQVLTLQELSDCGQTFDTVKDEIKAKEQAEGDCELRGGTPEPLFQSMAPFQKIR